MLSNFVSLPICQLEELNFLLGALSVGEILSYHLELALVSNSLLFLLILDLEEDTDDVVGLFLIDLIVREFDFLHGDYHFVVLE